MRVGDTVIEIDCSLFDLLAGFRAYFGCESVADKPDAVLRLDAFIPEKALPTLPYSPFSDKRVGAEGFSIGEGTISGRFVPGKGRAEVQVSWPMAGPFTFRVFEQLLYQLFYSTRKGRDKEAFLIHSCGIIRDAAGFLFLGDSDAGKSTVARLSPQDVVLNDEITLISFDGEGVVLRGTPFGGQFEGRRPGSAPLRAVLLLSQASRHQLCPVSQMEALKAIFRQIVPPVRIEEELTHQTRVTMLDVAQRLSGSVPVRRLEFLPDSGFWREIQRDFLSEGADHG